MDNPLSPIASPLPLKLHRVGDILNAAKKIPSRAQNYASLPEWRVLSLKTDPSWGLPLCSSICIKNGAFSEDGQVGEVKDFLDSQGGDLAYFEVMRRQDEILKAMTGHTL